jgi:hypothetical protein
MAYHPRLGQFAASGAQATDLPSARVMAGKAFSRFRAVRMSCRVWVSQHVPHNLGDA